jgi:hypothetical protein
MKLGDMSRFMGANLSDHRPIADLDYLYGERRNRVGQVADALKQ